MRALLNFAPSALLASVFMFGQVPAAQAALMTFFGEDLAPGGAVPAGGNAETAELAFLSNLSGVGTESFEGFADGSSVPFNLNFPGSSGGITATLSSSGTICNTNTNCTPPAAGEFPTDGDKWLFTSQDMVLDFSDPISAFGFFATDVGDFGGSLQLTLTNGTTEVININNTGGDGSLFYFGVIDDANSYTRIEFDIINQGSDFFGFDEMTIGDIGQIRVPAPSALGLLLGAGIVSLVMSRRRSRKA